MFNDLQVAFINLKSIKTIYGYLLISLLLATTFSLGFQLQNANAYEQCVSFIYIALGLINFVSLFYGIYCSMLLIPPHISWLSRITVMAVLIMLYGLIKFFLDQRSSKYEHPYRFNLFETLIIGLTGLSVIEDIYFISVNTHIFMLTLTLPMHASLTLFSLLFIFTLSGICISLSLNSSAKEAMAKGDITTFSLFVLDAFVKTMTLFTIITCTWFNITILPINNAYIATTVSIILTALFSYIYFFLDSTFSLIKYRINDSYGFSKHKASPRSAKQLEVASDKLIEHTEDRNKHPMPTSNNELKPQ